MKEQVCVCLSEERVLERRAPYSEKVSGNKPFSFSLAMDKEICGPRSKLADILDP